MGNLDTNIVTNCNEHMKVSRTACYDYVFENITAFPIEITLDELGGDFSIAFEVASGTTLAYSLPYDGMFEIGYTVMEFSADNVTRYDYLFEMCAFIKCYENIAINMLCQLVLDPCDIIQADCLVRLNTSQIQTQLFQLNMLYNLYYMRVFNFKNYWVGASNTVQATAADLKQLTFIVNRIKAFIKNCNLNCEEKCHECK